ncbi:MAG: DNA polymerase I, partial [Sphaerochaetaceae bacterium]|nr:DNA polymerase I [Sphaerochaetaceae bacterium]
MDGLFDFVEPKEVENTKPNEKKQLFIMDGYGQIYRSYFAFMSNALRSKDGENISAVFGFFNTVLMLLRQYNPTYFVVAMDSKGKTFRHELYDLYKANREKTPEDLHSQIPIIERILDEIGICRLNQIGMEADDIIATLCKEAVKEGIEPVMVTGDKDLLQLVNDNVFALRPPRKGEKEYRLCKKDDVKELFGVYPEQIVDYLTILGDSSDNVPGIDGIGEKGAVKLLSEYGTLDNVYENIGTLPKGIQSKLEAARNHIELSRILVTLKDDVYKDLNINKMACSSINWEKAVGAFKELGSNTLEKGALKFLGNKGLVVEEEKKEEEPRAKAQRGEYKALISIDEVKGVFSQIKEGSVLAFDLETTDKDDMEAQVVGFSFSF